MNIDIVKNLNLDKKNQVKFVEFVNFASFAMRNFDRKAKISKISKTRVVPFLKENSYKKEQVTIQVSYKYNTSSGYK